MRDLKSESGYGSIGYIQLDVENSNGNGHGVSSSHPSSHYIPGLADHLEPEFHSVSRRSNRLIAVFNLLSTIVGGGTLSLPYAFSKCGYLGGTSLVLMSVFISIGSLQTLCILARKLGTAKYAEVRLYMVNLHCEHSFISYSRCSCMSHHWMKHCCYL